MTQVDINSIVIMGLLLFILYYVSNFKNKVKSLYRKEHSFSTQHFMNTQAKIRSLEFSPHGIVTIDIDGFVIAWNSGAASLFGYKEEEIIGRPLTIIIPERYRQRHIEGIRRLKSGGSSSILGKSIELEGFTKNRKEFPIKLTLWRWYEGVNVFYTGIIADISERVAREKMILETLLTYKRGEEVDNTGTWTWDVLNDKVYTTEGFNRIFDIEDGDIDSSYLLRRVYYEDLPPVEAAIKKAFEEKIGYKVQYRIVTRNGTLVKIEACADVELDSEGELVRLTGTIHKLI